jgi:hypothetical protein
MLTRNIRIEEDLVDQLFNSSEKRLARTLKDKGHQLPALCACHLWLSDQFFKQSAVVNHSLTQIFCAGLALRLKKRAFVGCTVVLENERMVHRDIRGSLLEVSYRITPRGHHVAK